MDRLTEIFSNGQHGVRGCGKNCKYAYEYCKDTIGCPALDDLIEKLAEYEDLKEQGKLLKLPCEVGDTVYSFSFYRVLTMHVESFIAYKDHVDAVLVSDTPENPFLKFDVDIKELGKRWFLTREEAEAVVNQQGR